jgi:uncharacterized protein (TIGR03437 family)
MKKLIFGAVCLGLWSAQAQPVIRSIVNAASGDFTQMARGSYISILGQNLGTEAGPPTAFPIPTTLGGAQVTVKPAAGTATFRAFLYYTSPAQINAVLPSAVPSGPADVTVTVGNATSTARRIQVADTSFGMFTINSQPSGIAIAQNYEPPGAVSLNVYTNPAKPGQTLILWGTGLGPYTASAEDGPPQAGNIVNISDVEVVVAGVSIKPFYAGRAPGIAGVDQINFTLPAQAPIPDGCSLTIQVKIKGNGAQMATIAKSTTKPVCSHAFALPADKLSALQYGATVNAATARITRSHGILGTAGSQTFGQLTESIQVLFRKFAANGSPVNPGDFASSLYQAPGTCSAFNANSNSGNFDDTLDVNINSSPLDAGRLTLAGPGKSMDVDAFGGVTKLAEGADIPGFSSAQSALTDGSWTFSGGGKDIGSFSAAFTLQNQFKLQNVPAAIKRGQPLTITWSGGGDSDDDLVKIVAQGLALQGPSPMIVCAAPARDHSFTVPAEMTGQLSSDAVGGGLLEVISTAPPVRFSAPLAAGGNLDSGALTMTIVEGYAGIMIQ